MLTAQQIKDKLTTNDIKKLMNLLGAELWEENDQELIYDTICHSGHSHKLYFYQESKNFVCYSECGNLDIFQIVIKVKDYSFPEAINWVTTQLGLSTHHVGFGNFELIDDWEFINRLKSKRLRKEKDKEREETSLKVYDESILNIFQKNWFDKSWIDDGISIDSMRKYEIQFHTLKNQIVIPHRNIDGDLIGVRVRNLSEENISEWGKYTPFMTGNTVYKHPLGTNLYGLHRNKDTIRLCRKLMLVESEKSVLQAESYFPEKNFTLALSGKNLTNQQIELIRSLNVREVILALDKEYMNVEDDQYKKWCEYINEKFIRKLNPFVIVTILVDFNGLLKEKDSPTDNGKLTLEKLMDNKIYV